MFRSMKPLTVAFVVLSLGALAACKPEPYQQGLFEVGRTTVTLTDRGRTFDVDIWYPVDPAHAKRGDSARYELYDFAIESDIALSDAKVSRHGPFPLIVHSHGNGSFSREHYELQETVASHGFIVLAPNHYGNGIFSVFRGEEEDRESNILNRVVDVSFLIDYMEAENRRPGGMFRRRVDTRAVGVSGHSFGGLTAALPATSADDNPIPGVDEATPDDRIAAIVPMAPSLGSPASITDAQLASISVPTLLIGGTRDEAVSIDPNVTRAFDLVSGPAYRVDILGANHDSTGHICDFYDAAAASDPDGWVFWESAFTFPILEGIYTSSCIDQDGEPPFIDLDEGKRLARLYVVAFWQHALKSDYYYLRYLTPHYARENDLEVEFFAR